MICLDASERLNYGSMQTHEKNALKGRYVHDTGRSICKRGTDEVVETKGKSD